MKLCTLKKDFQPRHFDVTLVCGQLTQCCGDYVPRRVHKVCPRVQKTHALNWSLLEIRPEVADEHVAQLSS